MLSRSFRFLASLAAVAVLATGLAACGGGSDSAQDLLKKTFGSGHDPIKSGRLALSLNFEAQGLKSLKGPLAIKLNGPFQSRGKGKFPALDLTLALTTSGSTLNFGAVSTGDKGFLRVQGTNYAVSDQLFKQFVTSYEQSASKGNSSGPSFQSLGIDPLRWLKDPKKVGSESAGGVDSNHITASIDVSRFLEDVTQLLKKASSLGASQANLPSGLTDQQRKDIEASVKSAKIDVWTGKDDNTLRRLAIDIEISVPSSVQPRAGGMTSGRLTFDLTLAELNKDQTITAPANARPFSELQAALQGQASSGSSSGAATTPSQSGGGGAGSSGSKYLDCVQKAGNDVAALQQCAALAGQ